MGNKNCCGCNETESPLESMIIKQEINMIKNRPKSIKSSSNNTSLLTPLLRTTQIQSVELNDCSREYIDHYHEFSDIYQPDLSIFQHIDANDIQCDKNSNNIKNPIENCQALNRLISALEYYSNLEIISNQIHQDIFMQFIDNIYSQLLNDYNHLIRVHETDLEDINKWIIDPEFSTFRIKECDLRTCNFTSRHQNKNQDQELTSIADADNSFNFWQHTMDSIHFYLFHLFESGLRMTRNPQINSRQTPINGEIVDNDDDIISDPMSDQTEISTHFQQTRSRKNAVSITNPPKMTDKFNIDVARKDESTTFFG